MTTTKCISNYQAARAMSPTVVNEAAVIQQGLSESEGCLKYLLGVTPDVQLELSRLCLEPFPAPVIGQIFFRKTKRNQLTFSCFQVGSFGRPLVL